MRIVEIVALDNGAHRNQTTSAEVSIPDGWAVIPDDMVLENFPFGEVTADEVTYYRDVEVDKEVTKTREVETFEEAVRTREIESIDEEGNPVIVTEEYTELVPVITTEEYVVIETVTEQEPYTVMTVTGWVAGDIPEMPDVVPEPSAEERLTVLEEENELLKAQINAQSEQMDFYEDCIAEMAAVVYA